MPDLTKEVLIEDLLQISKKYQKDNKKATAPITQRYYRKHGNFKESEYEEIFGSFTAFKEETFDNIDEFKIEKRLHELEEENKRLKKDKKKLIENSSIEDKFLGKYESALQGLNIKIPKSMITQKSEEEDKEAILVLSDFHAAEIIIPEEVNFLNEYNISVMKRRIDRIFHYFVYYCKKNKITIAHIFFLGDLFAGNIHEELIRTNEMDEVDTLFMLDEYITKKLLEIEKHFKSITCEFLVGNHSRLSKKVEYKSAAKLNWEYILARQLETKFQLLESKTIKINVNNSLFKVTKVQQRRFLITHGTSLGKGGGGFSSIPYYGLAMKSAKIAGVLGYTYTNNEGFDDIIMGHLHSTAKVKTTTGNLYINGSVVGTGDFALHGVLASSPPEQTMLIVHKRNVINEIVLRGEE